MLSHWIVVQLENIRFESMSIHLTRSLENIPITSIFL